MASQYKTPGVYTVEKPAFPMSVVPVPTAIPAFVGYTERAEVGGKAVRNTPVRINSLAEYQEIFGHAPSVTFAIAGTEDAGGVGLGGKRYALSPLGPVPGLHAQMRCFFMNGGGDCLVVSVGSYEDAASGITLTALSGGLGALDREHEPTLLVVPEAVSLPTKADFETLARKMLAQCGTLQDRFAILDVHGAEGLDQSAPDFAQQMDAVIADFRQAVGLDHLSYGAAYFPLLRTTVFDASDIDYRNFDNAALQALLTEDATARHSGDALAQVLKLIESTGAAQTDTAQIGHLDAALRHAVPVLRELEAHAAALLGVLPPSGTMAGLYANTDNSFGVWKAPANLAPVGVVGVTVNVSDAMQEDLNVPLDGKAVNAFRDFPGRGTLVWGARTLDGNSLDWRYVNVRRTVIYLEQSIKNGLAPFVFASNDESTWSTVRAMLEGFLTNEWKAGALAGTRAGEAFFVNVGLGSTMTQEDVENGLMIVQVGVAVVRPAEFIILTFRQQMAHG